MIDINNIEVELICTRQSLSIPNMVLPLWKYPLVPSKNWKFEIGQTLYWIDNEHQDTIGLWKCRISGYLKTYNLPFYQIQFLHGNELTGETASVYEGTLTTSSNIHIGVYENADNNHNGTQGVINVNFGSNNQNKNINIIANTNNNKIINKNHGTNNNNRNVNIICNDITGDEPPKKRMRMSSLSY